MAKMMSIIRYKYKADRDFESVQFEGTSCPLGELKRLIIEKSTRSGTHHPKDDFDLIISNATTNEEYKDPTDMIERNKSVIVTRRMRGFLESLTPSTTRKPVISSDDIVNKYLRPVITSSAVVETKAVPLEVLNQPSNNNDPAEELSEEERLKQVIKSSQPRYMQAHRPNTTPICHNCKQSGHLKSRCPSLLSSANSTGHINGSSSSSSSVSNEQSSKSDATNSSVPRQPVPPPSHIITNQPPYHPPYRPRHTRADQMIRRPTGIPKDGLIAVPGPATMPGVLTDKTGVAVVPKPMAQLMIENSEKKADALAQRVQPPTLHQSTLPGKSTDEELPPDDLVCTICKQVYNDAVITPCCHNSFCDGCIRNALIESEDHECPHCHRQRVTIDHINPNLFLRKHVNQWREERLHKSSYSYMSMPTLTSTTNHSLSQTSEHSIDPTSTKSIGLIDTQNSNDSDEYDAAVLSTDKQQQKPVVTVKTAPIFIKMQPSGRSPSPSSQPAVETKPADLAFEDEKSSDNDQTTSSQKEKIVEIPTANNSTADESSDKLTDSNISENEKSDRHTPPSQVAPVNTIFSSPPTTITTTMASTASGVPHYYPTHTYVPPHVQPVHHGLIYQQQIPSTSSAGLYPIPPNFYPPTMHVPYPGAAPVLTVGGMAHYPGHPSYPPMHPHHSIPSSHLNEYHLSHYDSSNVPSLHHANPAFTNPSASTMLPHPNQTLVPPTLSKNEFYLQQRSLQRTKRSTSRRRSRSSSYSSYTSSGSRTSSYSRRNDRYHRRPSPSRSRSRRPSRSRSRGRQRVDTRRRDDNRTVSPSRQPRHRSTRSRSKQRRSPGGHRSPSHRSRARAPPPPPPSSKDNHSSSHRRASPPPPPQRSTRDRERRRSPRPPPTIPQSTQRTIVYSHDSSSSKQHSNRDYRRSKSRSRHRSGTNDDRTAPSSKTDHRTQSESTKSISSVTVSSNQRHITLSSIITPVSEKNTSKKTNQSKDIPDDNNRKRRKYHEQPERKHRRHRSRSFNSRDRKVRDSQDDDEENIVVENTTSDSRRVIEAQ